MTVENIDLWVSATGLESPYYRFYTDSGGSQQLSELAFDTSKSLLSLEWGLHVLFTFQTLIIGKLSLIQS